MSFAHTIAVLEERVRHVPAALAETLTGALPDLPEVWRELPIMATGLGSSQSAARLLVSELNRRKQPRAVFRGTADCFQGATPLEKMGLVVFSQGLSPNARIALSQAERFAGVLLVTSVGVAPERPELKAQLRQLEGMGAVIWRHPLENEYTILPRLIGPPCAAAVAIRLAAWATETKLEVPKELERGDPVVDPSADTATAWAEEWLRGVDFNFTNRTADYAENLRAKAMEALLERPPDCRDVMEFAHGPFQLNEVAPRPQWIFSGNSSAEAILRERLEPLFARAAGAREIVAPFAAPWDLFYYEQLLNHLLVEAVRRKQIDLVDWPGKGADGAGYAIDRPYQGHDHG